MIDKKGTEEDEFQDSFGEDFELQDESSVETPSTSSDTVSEKRRIPTQYIIASGVTVVLLVASYFGYRYFNQRAISLSKAKTAIPAVQRAKAATITSTTTPPTTVAKTETNTNATTITPTTSVQATSPLQAAVQTANQASSLKTETTPTPKELTENEIAQAFSSADKSPLPSNATASTATVSNISPPANTSNTPAPNPFASVTTQKPAEKVENKPENETNLTMNMQLQQLNTVLDKLNQQMETNLNQIKYLDSYTQEISKTMHKINESISAMDHRLLAVTNTTQNLSNEVGTVRNEVGQVKQVLGEDVLDLPPGPGKMPNMNNSCAVPCPVETEYVVHAAIPGRVWLKSAKGQIITLCEGEVLGNYGKILVIDAVNGVVLTSSGTTFR